MYHTFSTQKIREKIIVPSIVKLRRAKVVVKVDSIHERNQRVACIRLVSHRTRLVFFFPEKTLGGWRALLLLWSLAPLL